MAETQLTLTGRSGRVYDLTRDAHRFIRRGSLRGLGTPELERFKRPRLGHGSRDVGFRVNERPVEMEIFAHEDSALAYLAADRQFWSDLNPHSRVTWTATMPDGTKRTLGCVLAGESNPFDVDPLTREWSTFTVLMDGDPFWLGEIPPRSWGQVGYTGSWLLAPGSSPVGVVRFAPGQTYATATVANPGDVDAWPTWTITGPASSWSVGVGSQTITSSTALLEGQSRTIVTDGGGVYVTDQNGVDRFTELVNARATAIPAGRSVRIAINLVGAGGITLEFQPRYLRAF